ncbi:MAG: hypothetical protein J5999_03020 [Oscillospiraceae bacterium]|nr:hypothetical protein [Oscillospiraceae bacterium]
MFSITSELDAWSAENGYSLRICPSGYYELKKNTEAMPGGELGGLAYRQSHCFGKSYFRRA